MPPAQATGSGPAARPLARPEGRASSARECSQPESAPWRAFGSSPGPGGDMAEWLSGPFHTPAASCEYGRQRDGDDPALALAWPVRRNMTDNPSPGMNGPGEADNGAAQPQPWFPPSGEPGG